MVEEGFKQYTVDDYKKLDRQALLRQRLLLKFKLRAAKECLEEGDDRAPKALAYFTEQIELLNEALHFHMYGPEGPPSQEVQMKTISMAGDGRMSRPDQNWNPLAQYLQLFKTEEVNG